MKEVICTCCPQGCHLQVDEANDYKVTGNGCPNGIAYGKEELTHPTRIITSTVRAEGCLHSRCPVKTSKPVPKGQMAEVVAALDSVVLHAPIHVGDVMIGIGSFINAIINFLIVAFVLFVVIKTINSLHKKPAEPEAPAEPEILPFSAAETNKIDSCFILKAGLTPAFSAVTPKL